MRASQITLFYWSNALGVPAEIPFQIIHQGKEISEHNILNLRLDPSDSLKFHDNTLVQLIYACLERDASKRMTCEEVMRYQDELEEQIFGVAVSRKHFDLQLRQT